MVRVRLKNQPEAIQGCSQLIYHVHAWRVADRHWSNTYAAVRLAVMALAALCHTLHNVSPGGSYFWGATIAAAGVDSRIIRLQRRSDVFSTCRGV